MKKQESKQSNPILVGFRAKKCFVSIDAKSSCFSATCFLCVTYRTKFSCNSECQEPIVYFTLNAQTILDTLFYPQFHIQKSTFAEFLY